LDKQLKDYENAIVHYKKAIEAFEIETEQIRRYIRHAWAYNNLGYIYEYIYKDKTLALEMYNKPLELDPDNALAQNNLSKFQDKYNDVYIVDNVNYVYIVDIEDNVNS